MSKRILLCLTMLVSACAVDPGDKTDPAQDVAAASAEAAARKASSEPKTEDCKLAEELGLGKLAVQSCLAAAPINAGGAVAQLPDGTATTQACNTYYGSCSGISGCSRAVGGGWEVTFCGSWLYTWMTVCDGQPTGWGTGFCLF